MRQDIYRYVIRNTQPYNRAAREARAKLHNRRIEIDSEAQYHRAYEGTMGRRADIGYQRRKRSDAILRKGLLHRRGEDIAAE